MKKTILYSLVLSAAGAFLFSCAKENSTELKYETQSLVIPTQAPNYAITATPRSLTNLVVAPAPVINNDIAFLGRVLFYDKKLSINNTVSCGSCHKQAFADSGAGSIGFNGEKTSRNSMAICNSAFTKGFFWDKRAQNIEDLVLQPVRNHVEMGMESTDALIKKLNKVDYYGTLFERAFGTTEINREKVVKAMSTFLNSMVSARSKFDEGKNQSYKNFTSAESEGMKLFQKECGSCHSGSSFNSNSWDEGNSEAANIGLEADYTDPGMGAFVGKNASAFDNINIAPGFGSNAIIANGVFKVPSLRNVELTGPYMHDGRFKTLEDVVNHYNSGIQNHPALDWRLQGFDQLTGKSSPKKFNWTEKQKFDLISFLKTLTDQNMVSDQKFSNPFVR
jgi:cytochrome c peroxidase